MQDIKQQQILVGLNRDASPDATQDGTYTYALNMMKGLEDLDTLNNELSNNLCVTLPYPVIGKIPVVNVATNKMEFVLFLTDDINSEMGVFNPDQCIYTKLDISCNLNLNRKFPVRGVSKVLDHCSERVIYWTDNKNPYRFLNIDKLEDVDACADLNLFNCVNDDIEVEQQLNDAGGFLTAGVYQIGVRYVTRTGTTTQLVYLSELIPVIDEASTIDWRYRDGATPETITNKSITVNITNINPDQEYVQVILFKYQHNALLAYASENILAYGGEIIYNITGTNENPINLAEVLVEKAFYNVGSLIAVHQDRLYLGDVQQSRHINYQPLANNITAKWKTIKLPLTEDNYKESYAFKTWMGDERYALAIVWKFCDGSYSYAFHIPGPKEEDLTCFEPILSKLQLTFEPREEDNTYEDITYTSIYDIVPTNDINNFYNCPKYVWEVFNTAGVCARPHETVVKEYDDCGILISEEVGTWEEGHMAYHEQRERYPAMQDCAGNFIYPHSMPDCIDGTISLDINYFVLEIPPTTITVIAITNWTVSFPHTSMEVTVMVDGEEYLTSAVGGPSPQLHIPTSIFNSANTIELIITVMNGDTPHTVTHVLQQPIYSVVLPLECDSTVPIMDRVRHHRMPDRRLIPHFSSLSRGTECDDVVATPEPWADKHIYPIAVELENVVPPTDAELPVVGYELVYVRRTDANKSVVAKGLVHHSFLSHYASGTVGAHPMYVVNGVNGITAAGASLTPYSDNNAVTDWYMSKQVKFHSPNTSFVKGLVSGQQLKIEQYWKGFGRVYAWADFDDSAGDSCCGLRYNVNMCDNHIHPYNHNFKIVNSSYLPAHKIVGGFTFPFINYHQESGVGLELNRRSTYKLSYDEDDVTCYTQDYFAAMISDYSHKVFSPGQPCNDVNCAIAYYATIKRQIDYGSLTGLTYTRTGAARLNDLFFGDAFINYWVYRRTALVSKTWALNCQDNHDPENTLIHGIYESDINVDLRHEGDTRNGEFYYPKMGNGEFYVDVKAPGYAKAESTILTQWRYNLDTEQYINTGIDNYFGYNRDYSAVNITRIFPGIPPNYLPCECDDRLINTVPVSDPDTGNDMLDGWRTFRVNNYIDVPRTTGQLKNIFSMNNNFYAHTTNNLWRFLTSQTQIEGSSSSVYLGSSDIFSTTPQYLYMVPEGFAGTMQSDGYLINSDGYNFVDSVAGVLYTLGEGIKPINKGLTKWLNDNLKFKLLETVPNYPIVGNPLMGIGWHITLDNEYKRLIITKKDYEFRDPTIFGGDYDESNCEVGKIYLVQDRLVRVIDIDCSYEIISLTDEQYFCDVSWTLSYSYMLQGFVSWHSYKPYMYLHTRDKMFSVSNTSIYTHNIKNHRQTFYGEYYPFEFEFVTKSDGTSIWDSMIYFQDAFEYIPAYKKEMYKDVTFTNGLVYNSTQNSGWFDFVYKSDAEIDNMLLAVKDTIGKVRVNRIEKAWYYNEHTDITVSRDEPHMIYECLEEVPNLNILDPTKPYYNIMPFRDTYIVQRLKLNDPALATTRFNVKLFASGVTKSLR